MGLCIDMMRRRLVSDREQSNYQDPEQKKLMDAQIELITLVCEATEFANTHMPRGRENTIRGMLAVTCLTYIADRNPKKYQDGYHEIVDFVLKCASSSDQPPE